LELSAILDKFGVSWTSVPPKKFVGKKLFCRFVLVDLYNGFNDKSVDSWIKIITKHAVTL